MTSRGQAEGEWAGIRRKLKVTSFPAIETSVYAGMIWRQPSLAEKLKVCDELMPLESWAVIGTGDGECIAIVV